MNFPLCEVLKGYGVPDVAEVKIFLKNALTAESALIDSFTDFVKSVKDIHEPISQIKCDYIHQWDTKFNIFKIISPTYYERENLHNDIIGAILDPITPEIDNPQYVRILLKLLHSKNNTIEEYDFGNSFEVCREVPVDTDGLKGRIDILVHNETHAVIIENKINNAPDMDNQLARYYKHVTHTMKKEVVAVVYLPLDPKKEPPLFDYESEFKSIVEEMKPKLVVLPVISEDGKNDFVHGFLEPCREKTTNEKAKFFLDQYINLVKYRGGNNMISLYQKDLLKEIYKDEKTKGIVGDIADVWWNKEKLLLEIIGQACIGKLENMGFTKNSSIAYTRQSPLSDLNYAFQHVGILCFGFYGGEPIITETEKLRSILEDGEFIKHFSEIKSESEWLYKSIPVLDFADVFYDGSSDSCVDFIVAKYKKLIEKTESVFKT